jgi:uncharacterized membrane protein YcaP (DUF421 family)
MLGQNKKYVMRNEFNKIVKYLLIGFVAIIPGVMVMSVVSRLELMYAIPLFIFLQFIIGYFTTVVVNKTSKYKLGDMNNLIDVTTSVDVAQGYMKWVKINEAEFTEDELKQHYLHAKKITGILENLNESNRDPVTK